MDEIVSKVIESKVVKYFPVVLQSQQFSSTAMEVTESISPLSASFKGLKLILHFCLPPNIKYPVKCAIFFGQLGISVYTAGMTGGFSSMLSLTLAIGSGRQVLEEML